MSKKVIIGLILVLLVAAGGAFAIFGMNNEEASAPSTSSNASTTDETSQSSDALGQPSAEQSTITFTSSGFSPTELTVKKGAVITVKNDSSSEVQFSSDDHPTHRENQEMNLRVLKAGESTTYTAETVGEWGFHDHIDDSKTGMITVTE